MTPIQPLRFDGATFQAEAIKTFLPRAPFNGVNPYPRPTATDYQGLKQLPFLPTASEAGLATDFKTQTNYDWSFSVQQALWKKAVVEANRHVGSHSSHLITSVEGNPAAYLGTAPCTLDGVSYPVCSTTANTQQRRLYPEIGDLNLIASSLDGNYNALQITFDQQFSHGVLVKSAFTWSKALQIAGCETEGCNGPRDPNNYRLDYGPSDFDVRDNWVTSFVWEPFGDNSSGSALRRYTISGWQFSGIYTMRTGFPLTLVTGNDNSHTGIGGDTGCCGYGPDWRSCEITGNCTVV